MKQGWPQDHSMNNRSSSLTTKDLVYIALAAVLICVCSWISIPMAVPFTLQTFAVFCALELLSGLRLHTARSYRTSRLFGLYRRDRKAAGNYRRLHNRVCCILADILGHRGHLRKKHRSKDSNADPRPFGLLRFRHRLVHVRLRKGYRPHSPRHGALVVRHTVRAAGPYKARACAPHMRPHQQVDKDQLVSPRQQIGPPYFAVIMLFPTSRPV